MMSLKTVCLFTLTLFAAPAFLTAQTYAPLVALRVITPDGDTREVTAREGAVTTVTLKDGTAYELRPTIHDEPFTRVTVAIFKAASSTEPTTAVGEVVLTKGGPALDSKTKPNFRIAATRIDAPATNHSS